MIEIWRSGQRYRGGDPATGIDTRHAFSFGAHYDPANVGFGLLVACNEERLAPGAGFAPHPHSDVEIVTWVAEGELEHRDSAGNAHLVRAGQAQRLSAGSGVRHSERNAARTPLRFIQMWLRPQTLGGDPDYRIDAEPTALRPLRQPGATLHVGRAGMALPQAPFVYLHVERGAVRIGGETLGDGDAARIRGETDVAAEVVGPPGSARFLVWEMHGGPGYRSFGLNRSEPIRPHAPNGLERTGPRRTRPRGGDTHPVRGPIPGGRFPARTGQLVTARGDGEAPDHLSGGAGAPHAGAVSGIPDRTITLTRSAQGTASL